YRNENTDLIHFQSCLHQKSEFERVMSCFFSGNLLTYWFVDLLTFKIGFLTEKANFLVFFLRKITILWGWVFLAMARCQ
ncbi:MAG: hypothetical protein SPH19_05790, partial [Sodaliphilus sp.]|nr:hypothetical protein [Sodaliphilus sp.]